MIVCDFDGTIILQDSVDEILKKFSKNNTWEIIEKEWLEGKINGFECLKKQLSGIKISRSELCHFINSLKLRPGFKKFNNFCKKNNLPILILSDGLKIVINNFLNKRNLNLPIIANDIKLIN